MEEFVMTTGITEMQQLFVECWVTAVVGHIKVMHIALDQELERFCSIMFNVLEVRPPCLIVHIQVLGFKAVLTGKMLKSGVPNTENA